jgi:hypothetical protein
VFVPILKSASRDFYFKGEKRAMQVSLALDPANAKSGSAMQFALLQFVGRKQ